MIDELKIEQSFLEPEEREGFFVDGTMKSVWAAQLVVLREIDRICQRHNITYFADWGTLLGAVRHKGFVPWDDDMDIAMKRADYRRFLQVAKRELPKGYHINVPDSADKYPNTFARVVNSYEISFALERMEAFYGCPYIVGIDIFPLDKISKNQEEEELRYQVMVAMCGALTQCQENGSELERLLCQVEEFLNVQIDRNADVEKQILCLLEYLMQIYEDEEADEYTLGVHYAMHKDFKLKKEWYQETLELPFENITLPVPVGYDEALKKMYGDYHVRVKNVQGHKYPFYKAQQELVENYINSQK